MRFRGLLARLRGIRVIAVAFAVLSLAAVPREAAAQPAGFTQAVIAVGGTFSGLDIVGSLQDGSALLVSSDSSNVVSFAHGGFTIATDYTVVSSGIFNNVAIFKGFYNVANGPAIPFDCAIDLATSAYSGNCSGFLGLGGVAATQSAILASVQGQLRAESLAYGAMIGNHMRDLTRELAARRAQSGSAANRQRRTGVSAGTEPARYGVWADATGSYIDNGAPGKAYNGWSTTGVSGLDATIGNDIVVGFSVGYVNADLDLVSLGGSRHSRGAVVGPYAAYVFGEHLTADVNITFGRLYNDITIGTDVPLRNHLSSNRWAAAANLNWFQDWGPLSLTGIFGTAVAYEHQPSSTNTAGVPFPTLTARFSALKLGGEIAWPLGDAEPYMPIGYEYQMTAPRDGTNRHSLNFGLGLRYRFDERIKAGILATTEEIRSNERTTTIGANLRFSF